MSRRRSHLRRLPEPLRAEALASVAADSRAGETWIWSELLELACFQQTPIHPFISQLRNWAKISTPEAARVRDIALRAIATGWNSMSPTERSAAMAIGSKEWGRVAIEVVESGCFGPIGALVSFLTDVGDETCVRALFRVASVEHPGAEDADRAAMKLVQSALVRAEERELTSLVSSMADALERPDARIRRGMAWSAWTLMESAPAREPAASDARRRILVRTAASDEGPGRALASVLRWDRDPLIRLAAFRWCLVPGLERSCLDRLGRASTAQEHELVLSAAHLAARPARARLLGIIHTERSSTSGPVPEASSVPDLSLTARRNLARFAAALGNDATPRLSPLEPLLTDADEHTRLTVALRGTLADARDLCFDPSHRVSRVAITRWTRCGITPIRRRGPSPEVRRILDVMAMSPHVVVRRIASEDLRAADPFHPEFVESRVAARRSLQADPSAFISLVRSNLANGDVATRMRTIRTIEWLHIVREIRVELIALLAEERPQSEEDQRLRATIARSLGTLSDAESIDAVERLSGDPDPRVQANAIDALVLGSAITTRPDEILARLVELKNAVPHRVRGASVRGLAALAARSRFALSDAMAEIRSLRHDTRPSHALAGAWVASRARIYFEPGTISIDAAAETAP